MKHKKYNFLLQVIYTTSTCLTGRKRARKKFSVLSNGLSSVRLDKASKYHIQVPFCLQRNKILNKDFREALKTFVHHFNCTYLSPKKNKNIKQLTYENIFKKKKHEQYRNTKKTLKNKHTSPSRARAPITPPIIADKSVYHM